jgi:hypothetical protein
LTTYSTDDDAGSGGESGSGALRAGETAGAAGADGANGDARGGVNTARRVMGGLAGLALFAGAIAAIVYAGSDTHETVRRLIAAPAPILALLLVLPVANLMLTSLCFQALTRRYAFVEPHEMHALIAGSFLLNFLPLRPGLFGRVAYHTRVHKMRVRDAARVLVEALGCTAVAMLLLLATIAMTRVSPVVAAGFMGIATIALVVVWMRARQTRNVAMRAYALATLIKLADILLWGGRYVVVFALLGRPIAAREGVSLAVVANAASLVPLAGNGLGLREWAVGIVAATLPSQGAADIVIETGLSADLVNRASEIIVAVVLGVPALIWLSRRMARARREG